MLYLSQDPSECGTITGGSTLTNIRTLSDHADSIDSSDSNAECKNAEVLWKVRLNFRKVEAAVESGSKKMLLATFNDTYTSKLKHSIELNADA